MRRNTARPTLKSITDSADILLYGQWVPVPPGSTSLKDAEETLRDFLDVNTHVGAVGRAYLAEHLGQPSLDTVHVEAYIREAARLYVGILHYSFGLSIPDDVIRFLASTSEVSDGQPS